MLSISFEGGEGCGKSTVIKLLDKALEQLNIPHLVTREPGGTPIGEYIREAILGEVSSELCDKSEVLLFAACRSQILRDVIHPAIKENTLVILDRYVHSSYVYQGIVRGFGDDVRKINDFATDGFMPDKVFFFDLDPEVGLNRIFGNNRNTNRIDHESIEFHKKVRAGYLELCNEFPNIIKLDASKTPDELLQLVLKEIL